MLDTDSLARSMERTPAWWPFCTDRGRNWIAAGISTVAFWGERSRSRRALAALDDGRLRDVGLSRADAWRESAKPFWIA